MLLVSILLPLAVATVIAVAGVLPGGPGAGRPPASGGPAFTVRRGAAVVAPLAVVPAVLLAMSGAGRTVELPWLLFGSVLTVDAVARPLLLIAALLYGAALMAVAWIKLRHAESGASGLTAFLLVGYVGNIGTYLAADAATFYLFFAVMSFSAAGLVVFYRTGTAHRATRVYLVLSVLSETSILAALMLVVHAGGMLLADAPAAVAGSAHPGLILALLFIGFGVKAGLVPLHVWLPLAHPAAPPAASAVLSGAMVKAGVVGWLRFLPLGEGTVEWAGGVLLVLALAGALLAVLVGVLQRDPKVVLAYSTISQLSFMTALVAAGLLDPDLAPRVSAAAVVYAVHHGLAKGALFLGVPVVKHYGRGPSGVLVTIGMVGAGLAVAGAPLTSGAFGKYVSKEAVAPVTVLGVGLDSLLPLVATGSTLQLMRLAWLLWHTDRYPRRRPDGELVSWLLVAAAGIVVPWLVGEAWTPVPVPAWEPYVVWNAMWPILLGLGLGFGAWFLAARGLLPDWVPRANARDVEPGDLVVAGESALSRLAGSGGPRLERVHGYTRRVASGWAGLWSRTADRTRRAAAAVERRLEHWDVTGAVLLVLLAAALVLMLLVGRGNG